MNTAPSDNQTRIVTVGNTLKFLYHGERTTTTSLLNEVIDVFNDVVILESSDPKYKKDDKIEQISLLIQIYFEHNDGTPY